MRKPKNRPNHAFVVRVTFKKSNPYYSSRTEYYYCGRYKYLSENINNAEIFDTNLVEKTIESEYKGSYAEAIPVEIEITPIKQ